ncbi:ATP-binding protein [Bacillus taeanensis]|uniref:ATP-binding protein n=1 Tax=Bacillus taeanensis TaxID=273032 RepID=UPI0015F07241|nr:ATP-binding protein [Bacillus taeanensis]
MEKHQVKQLNIHKNTLTPTTITMLYFFIGSIWVMFSDEIVFVFFKDPEIIIKIQTYKGWLFVIITSALLFLLIYKSRKQLIKKQTALKESETRYRQLIELFPEAIFVHRSGTILFSNKEGLKILSAAQLNDIIGKSIKQFIAPEDLKLVEKHAKHFHFHNHHAKKFECKISRLNGEKIDAETTSIPILYEEVPAILSVTRNITERKRTEELLRKSEKLSTAGKLAAAIAHEIRNPLTSVKGFLQLINKDNSNISFIPLILEEIERIEKIVNEMLVLAKPQAQHFGQCDITKLLEQTVILLNSEAVMHNVEIVMNDIETSLPKIYCDQNQLKQVFINIFKNGIEAMPKGGNIFVNARSDFQDWILIQFIDQGYGIPKEKIRALGEPFYTTKDTGTGLGLMYSFNIIKNHHGKISFSSEENKGTTVTLTLPINFKSKQTKAQP